MAKTGIFPQYCLFNHYRLWSSGFFWMVHPMSVRFGPRPFTRANVEAQNAPHFMKGALTALAGWWLYMNALPFVGWILLWLAILLFGAFSRTWWGFILATLGLSVALKLVLGWTGQDGPLGFAFAATLSLAVAVEFWQVSRGDESDGFDFLDLGFDASGWLYLAGVVEICENIGLIG